MIVGVNVSRSISYMVPKLVPVGVVPNVDVHESLFSKHYVPTKSFVPSAQTERDMALPFTRAER